MWNVYVAGPAKKRLKKITKQDASRILVILQMMQNGPFDGDIVKLEENIWRRRIGNYRIIYEIFAKEKVIHILDIRRRASSTY